VADYRLDERRFRDLVLYVSAALHDDPNFGSTKLNKVLFFSDTDAFLRLGHPITGAEYQKNHHGPTARRYVPLLNEMARLGLVTLRRETIGGHEQIVTTPLMEPDLTQFSPDELAIVDDVVEDLRSRTNVETSDLSHLRSAGWQAMELGETIPYRTAIISTEPVDEDVVNHFRRLEGLPT
jgi:hypothetical protein